jgi:SOS-response transcriptional repressor LexA
MYMPNEGIHELITRLRTEKRLSKYKLAQLSGLRETYIGQLEAGKIKHPRQDTLTALAKGLGMDPSVFFGKEIEPRHPKDALSDLQVSIGAYVPVLGEVSAGPGMEPIDYVATTRTKAAPENIKALRVKGLCLEPEIIDGDTLIVDKNIEPHNNDLVVVFMDGQASVKRYKVRPAAMVSENKNKKYDGKTVEKNTPDAWLENGNGKYRPEDVRQVGVVVEFIRKRR